MTPKAAQSAINRYPSEAVAGDRASQEPIVHLPYNCIAEATEDGTQGVIVGQFVWAGTAQGLVMNSTSVATDKPLGLVERLIDHFNYDVLSDGTMLIAEGQTVTVVTEGDMYAVSSTAATYGQKVYANTKDGSISTNSTGQTVSNSVESNWWVKKGGAAGEVIIIGTMGQAPATPGFQS